MRSNGSTRPTHYGVNRWTLEIDLTPQEFGARYEEAVPPLPVDDVSALAARQAPWQDMIDLMDTASTPFGFVLYQKSEFPLMRLAGDNAACTMYLIGNHILAERMFRHDPAVVLYAPLHTVVWGPVGGPAHLSFDQPSSLFGSFGIPDITAVGVELDHKFAALLDHLGVGVPAALLAS